MKRSGIQPGTKGLTRGAGLSRGKPLERGKPIARGESPSGRGKALERGPGPARTPMKTTARRTGATVDVRTLVVERDGGRCQRCGAPGTNVQHREGRGAGGRGKADAERTNGPEWLVLLCGYGNGSGCHKAVDDDRVAAEADGFVIRRNGPVVDAATVPVRTYAGWRLLTPDGRSMAA